MSYVFMTPRREFIVSSFGIEKVKRCRGRCRVEIEKADPIVSELSVLEQSVN